MFQMSVYLRFNIYCHQIDSCMHISCSRPSVLHSTKNNTVSSYLCIPAVMKQMIAVKTFLTAFCGVILFRISD